MNEKVIDILFKLSGKENIETDNTLVDDLGLDSLLMVSLLIEIEEAFDIELDESDMNPFELISVNDVVSLVSKYCGEINE